MKKIFTLLTGILLLVAILIAGGCHRLTNAENKKGPKDVTIHLKSVKKNGEKHLKLSDSNGNVAIDHLITNVIPGTTVIWKPTIFSRIDNIERIYSSKGKIIFVNDAKRQGSGNVFKLKVPDVVAPGTMEEYIILYTSKDGSRVEIDPYIRIEDDN